MYPLISPTQKLAHFVASLSNRVKGSIGHCHVDHGCKLVLKSIPGPNGIARGHNETVYIANTFGGKILVAELQSDDSLVLTDTIVLGTLISYPMRIRRNIFVDRMLDNISVDSGGHLWVAGDNSDVYMC